MFLIIALIIFNHFNNRESVKSKSEDDLESNISGKKVLIDGEIDSQNMTLIRERLKHLNAELEYKMSKETNILITGKNADELVIEEAKTFGTKIYCEDTFFELDRAPQYTFSDNLKSSKTSEITI